jgi:D-glycero-alpha-D-manno-heptose 1-phosphate guanylyltransferase
MVKTAIILAGGFGTRLRSVVSNVPKPMAPINGKPFLEYQLDYLIGQGIKTIYLAVGYKHEVISQYFGNSFKDATLIYSVEDKPLGTGGALLRMLRIIKKTTHS